MVYLSHSCQNTNSLSIIKQVHARYAGNGKYYPATISQIQEDKIVVNWIDNDSKYRDVELDHIETLGEKATSNIWIDAVVIEKVERDVEDDDDDDDDDTEKYKVRVTVTENVKDDNPCVQVVPISQMRHPVPKSHIVLLVQRRNGIPFSSPLAIRVKSVTAKRTLTIL